MSDPLAPSIDTTKSNDEETRNSRTERLRRDINYTTELNRWFLRPIGIWPVSPKASNYKKILIDTQISCCFLLTWLLIVPVGLHTFLEENDPLVRLTLIGPLSFNIMAVMKYCLLVFHRNDIYLCLEHISRDWSYVRKAGNREIMLNEAKLGRFIAGWCACFMYGGGFIYSTIMPFSSGEILTPDNVSLRPFSYPVYDGLFDAQASPTYEIIFIIQWFGCFVICSISVGVCSIASIFSMHACGQFNVLVVRLKGLVDADDASTVDERMADIVQLHLRTLDLVGRVDSILNEICLIEFVGSTMCICLAGYYLIMLWQEWESSMIVSFVAYCFLLVSFIFNVFIYCWIGEILKQQSNQVGTMTYMIDWYRLQSTKARCLTLILVRSKNSPSITAGKMIELSIQNFGNVMKTALTYLNLLRTVTN